MIKSIFEKGINIAVVAFKPAADMDYEVKQYRSDPHEFFISELTDESCDDSLNTCEHNFGSSDVDYIHTLRTIAAVCISNCHNKG